MPGLSLPSPYPDELIGSILVRAVAHTGLPPKRLLLRVFGYELSHQSMLLPTVLLPLAVATRKSPHQLLWEHTAFPYAVAFMDPQQVLQLQDKALSAQSSAPLSFGSLARSAAQGVAKLRFCPACVAEDVQLCGESYWHRLHCLPAVHVCLKHKIPLHVSPGHPRTLSQHLLLPLPQRLLSLERSSGAGGCRGRTGSGAADDSTSLGVLAEPTHCPAGLRYALAETTSKVFSTKWMHRDDWSREFRAKAIERRYTNPGGAVAGARLAYSLRELFGASYLGELGCLYEHPDQAWPATMVRNATSAAFAPVKYVLLDTLLRFSPTVAESFPYSYLSPGKKPRDFGHLDCWLAAMVHREAKRLLASKETATVKTVLQSLGCWETFRHERARLPLTEAQIQAFKRSDASFRKTGGRTVHAKRLRAIAEGRQKPLRTWSQRSRGR